MEFRDQIVNSSLNKLIGKSPIRVGDMVVLFANGDGEGFLTTLDSVDDRAAVTSDGKLEVQPLRIRDYLYIVDVAKKYEAQQSYQEARIRDPNNEAKLKKLRKFAEDEKVLNEEVSKSRRGDILHYGDTIQLLNVKNNKYLNACLKTPAQLDPSAWRVSLDKEGSDNSHLKVVDCLKFRGYGEPVTCGDEVFLVSVNGQKVHASDREHQDHKGCYEVNVCSAPTSWRILLYLDHSENLDGYLKAGDVFRLFHTESSRYLTLDDLEEEVNEKQVVHQKVFLRCSARQEAASATSSKALWEVEIRMGDIPRGGLAKWSTSLSLKHLSTGKYLALKEDPDSPKDFCEKQYYLYASSFHQETCEFKLDPTKAVSCYDNIPHKSPVRIYHEGTKTWLKHTNIFFDDNKKSKKDSPRCMSKVIATFKQENREVFKILPVSQSEVRDLDFANDAYCFLKTAVEKLRAHDLTGSEKKVLRTLLLDLMYFVVNAPRDDSKQTPPKISPSDPDRNRQKLVREQKLLDIIFELLAAPFENKELLEEKISTENDYNKFLVEILKYAYKLLQFSQKRYRKNQVEISKRFSFIIGQVEHKQTEESALETITVLIQGNTQFMEKFVKEDEIQLFISLLKTRGETGRESKSNILDLLKNLCVWNGESVKTQESFCKCLLNENPDVLIHTKMEDGEIYLYPTASKPEERKSLKRLVQEAKKCDSSRLVLDYYCHQLDLFCAMCFKRQYDAIGYLKEKEELSIDLIHQCMVAEDLPVELRAAFCRLMLHLHLDCRPNVQIQPIEYARVWADIPSKEQFENFDIIDAKLKSDADTTRRDIQSAFAETLKFSEDYLWKVGENGEKVIEPDSNILTLEVIKLVRHFMLFGFFNLEKLKDFDKIILSILKKTEKLLEHGVDEPIRKFHGVVVQAQEAKIIRPVSVRETTADPLMAIKLNIIEIENFIYNIRLDYRITKVLVLFKAASLLTENTHVSLDSKEIEEIFEDPKTDLDGKMGAESLKLMICFIINSKAYPLVSGALKLLYREFEQREEFLNALNQVQLLIKKEHVQIYEYIRKALEILKEYVEESETWVLSKSNKGKDEEEKVKIRDTDEKELPPAPPGIPLFSDLIDISNPNNDLKEDQIRRYNRIYNIIRTLSLCCRDNKKGEAKKLEQGLLQSRGLVKIIVDLLAICWDETNDIYMQKIYEQAYRLLQDFCYLNQSNQEELYEHFDKFLKPGQNEIETLKSIFFNNEKLCNELSADTFKKCIGFMVNHGKKVYYLEFLLAIVKSDNKPLSKLRTMILTELGYRKEDLFDWDGGKRIRDMMKQKVEEPNLDRNEDLDFHVKFIELLSACTEGKNQENDKNCAGLCPFELIAYVLQDKNCLPKIKEVYCKLLINSYIETEVQREEITRSSIIWDFLGFLCKDINEYLVKVSGPVSQDLAEYFSYGLIPLIHALKKTRQQGNIQQNPSSHLVEFLENCVSNLSSYGLRGEIRSSIKQLLDSLQPEDFAKQVTRDNDKTFQVTKYAHKWASGRRGKDTKFPGKSDLKIDLVRPTLLLNGDDNIDTDKFNELTEFSGGELVVKNEAFTISTREDERVQRNWKNVLDEQRSELELKMRAELSVLIDVFYRPAALFERKTQIAAKCSETNFIRHLIQHILSLVINETKEQIKTDEKVIIQTLQILTELVINDDNRDRELRKRLLDRYFNGYDESLDDPEHSNGIDIIPRKKKDVHTIQCELNILDAPKMVIEMMVKNPSEEIFTHAIKFAKALLSDGNEIIQKTFYDELIKGKTDNFIKNIYERMITAQKAYKTSFKVIPRQGLIASPEVEPPVPETLFLNGIATSTASGQEIDDSQIREANASVQNGLLEFENTYLVRNVADPLEAKNISPLGETLTTFPLKKTKLSPEVSIMEELLEFLRLLCENHYREMQDLLRNDGKKEQNLVAETFKFLIKLCGSHKTKTLNGDYLSEENVLLFDQTIRTLIEYCQGPCPANQKCIAKAESNGIEFVIELIKNKAELGSQHSESMRCLKINASKLLLAIIESSNEENFVEIVNKSIVDANLIHYACEIYDKFQKQRQAISYAKAGSYYEKGQDNQEIKEIEVGHNIYILCHQCQRYSQDLHEQMKQEQTRPACAEAMRYFQAKTAQVEIVRRDGSALRMEYIVFAVTDLCHYLTEETQRRVFIGTEIEERSRSKVPNFFRQVNCLLGEMEWQKELRQNETNYFFARSMSSLASLTFQLAILINTLVAIFYPFDQASSPTDCSNYRETWILLFIALLSWLYIFGGYQKSLALAHSWMFRLAVVSTTLTLIVFFGSSKVVLGLGILNLLVTTLYLYSFSTNRGNILTRKDGWRCLFADYEALYHLIYLLICIFGIIHPLFYAFLLLHLIYKEETLRNVIKSVTANGKSILLTALFAQILIFQFAIFGHIFFQADFRREYESENDGESQKESSCSTLIRCIITSTYSGLRSGGGIGDVLRPVKSDTTYFILRTLYDMFYFFVINLICLNLLFGVIIDTFAALRQEKQRKEDILRNTCFICGLPRSDFDNRVETTFEDHIVKEHNIWHYLYFMVLLKTKKKTDFTGPETYVYQLMENNDWSWFPIRRAMSLEGHEPEPGLDLIRPIGPRDFDVMSVSNYGY